jgi:hypothetical protein
MVNGSSRYRQHRGGDGKREQRDKEEDGLLAKPQTCRSGDDSDRDIAGVIEGAVAPYAGSK